MNSCFLKASAEIFFLACRKYQKLAKLSLLANDTSSGQYPGFEKKAPWSVEVSKSYQIGAKFTPKMHQMQPFEANIIKIFWRGHAPSPRLWARVSAPCSKAFSLCCLLFQPSCLLLKNILTGLQNTFWVMMSSPCFRMLRCFCTASKNHLLVTGEKHNCLTNHSVTVCWKKGRQPFININL